MSEESDERAAHVRGLVVTTVAALAGVAAAVVASVLTAGMGPNAAASSTNAQLTVLAAVVVQLPLFEVAFDEWGGAKDVVYVGFLTFVLWFVTYGIILTTGAQVV